MTAKITASQIKNIAANKFKKTRLVTKDGTVKDVKGAKLKKMMMDEMRGGAYGHTLKRRLVKKYRIIGTGTRTKERNRLFNTMTGGEKKPTWAEMEKMEPEELKKAGVPWGDRKKIERRIVAKKRRNVIAGKALNQEPSDGPVDSTRLGIEGKKYGIGGKEYSTDDLRGNGTAISSRGTASGAASAQGATGIAGASASLMGKGAKGITSGLGTKKPPSSGGGFKPLGF